MTQYRIVKDNKHGSLKYFLERKRTYEEAVEHHLIYWEVIQGTAFFTLWGAKLGLKRLIAKQEKPDYEVVYETEA